MILFIGTVLILAALQSFCKLSLIPRKWEIIFALLLSALPFCFENRVAHTSHEEMKAVLSGAAVLSNWCALVVIQELFSLVAGFSLLSELADGGEGGFRWRSCWKYLAFLPSLLLPAGTVYLQMLLFNTLVGWNFHKITVLLGICLPATLIFVAELCRWICKERATRTGMVLQMEYVLLFPAIFLPVAAQAKLVPGDREIFWKESLLLMAGLMLFEIVVMIIFYIYKRRKNDVCRYTNS